MELNFDALKAQIAATAAAEAAALAQINGIGQLKDELVKAQTDLATANTALAAAQATIDEQTAKLKTSTDTLTPPPPPPPAPQ